MEEKLTKKEIISLLKEHNIDFNSKSNKDELHEVLRNGLATMLNGSLDALNEAMGNQETEFKVHKYEASYKSKGRMFILGDYATVKDAENALDKVGANIRYINFKDK